MSRALVGSLAAVAATCAHSVFSQRGIRIRIFFVFFVLLSIAAPLPSLQAAITWTGDVDPTDPNTWDENTAAYIGNMSSGTVTVNSDSDLVSGYSFLGLNSDGVGTVGVDGIGSTWTTTGDMRIGFAGRGTLNISGGAAVAVDYATYVANEEGSTGTISFGAGGGTLMTKSLYALPTQFEGNGTITTRGLVSDIDLMFDSAASLNQTLLFHSQPDKTVQLRLDLASNPKENGDLGAGWKSSGSMTICNGTTVKSDCGYLAYCSGSTGSAVVDGAESTWIVDSILNVGHFGNGTLTISGGGTVNSCFGYIGDAFNSTGSSTTPASIGKVIVQGTDSMWVNKGEIRIGGTFRPGEGTLNISSGGLVEAGGTTYIALGANSTGTIDFGAGGGTLKTASLAAGVSQLTGTGTVNTCGLVSDIDLVFDSTESLKQNLTFNRAASKLKRKKAENWSR